jgi:addiction module HigA family antidote
MPRSAGEILVEDFLRPRGLTQAAFARRLGVPARKIGLIVRGKRGISEEMALLFARALDTTPQFWTDAVARHALVTGLWKPWGSNEYCSFCGARPGQKSDATGRVVTALYVCPRCGRNYCDQCSSPGREPDSAECMRCDAQMDRVAQLGPAATVAGGSEANPG